MKSVTIDLDKAAVLEKVSRMFTQSPASVLLELLQNARRAGADKAEVWILDDWTMISNNGRPLSEDDWRSMFSLGTSSWEGDVMSEDPAGCGFFISSLYDKVVIASRGDGEVEVLREDKNSLTKLGEELPIETNGADGIPWPVSVTLIGKGPVITTKIVEEIASRLDMRISMKVSKGGMGVDEERQLRNFKEWAEKGMPSDRWFSNRLIHIQDRDNVEWYFRRHTSIGDKSSTIINYHGHLIRLDDDAVKVYSGSESGTGQLYARVCGPVDLKLVLPGRNSVIEDEAYHKLIATAREMNGIYIDSLPDGHTMPYKAYEYVKKHYPKLQEAVLPRWAARLDEDETAIAVNYRTGLLGRFLTAVKEANCEKAHRMEEYEGYAWFDKLKSRIYLSRKDLKYRVDGGPVSLQIRDDEQEDFEPPHHKWLGEVKPVDDIEVLGHENKVLLRPAAIVLSEDMDDHWALGCWFESTDACVLWSKKKCVTMEDRLNEANDLVDAVLEIWEASEDSESDNWETQQSDFFAEFRPWVYESMCPESAMKSRLEDWTRRVPYCRSSVVELDDDVFGVAVPYGDAPSSGRYSVYERRKRVNQRPVENMKHSELLMELSVMDVEALRSLVRLSTK